MFKKSVSMILLLMLLIGILLTGCTFNKYFASDEPTVVLSKDVLKESNIADKVTKVPKISEITLPEDITYKDIIRDVLAINGEYVLYHKDRLLYKMDLVNKKVEPIASLDIKYASSDGSKILYIDNNNYYLYDLTNNLQKPLNINKNMEVTFADRRGKYVSYYDNKNIVVINTVTGVKHSINMSKNFTLENFMLMGAKVYYDKLYVAIHTHKDGLGIYRLGYNGEKTTVLKFPYKFNDTDSLAEYDLLDNGNTLVFNGEYGGDPGIYFYDITKKTIKKVLSGGKNKEGSWIPFYSLSPNGEKIAIDIPYKGNNKDYYGIYVANISKGTLSQAIHIMDNTNMPSAIEAVSNWSNNSSKLYIRIPFRVNHNDKDTAKIKEFSL